MLYILQLLSSNVSIEIQDVERATSDVIQAIADEKCGIKSEISDLQQSDEPREKELLITALTRLNSLSELETIHTKKLAAHQQVMSAKKL